MNYFIRKLFLLSGATTLALASVIIFDPGIVKASSYTDVNIVPTFNGGLYVDYSGTSLNGQKIYDQTCTSVSGYNWKIYSGSYPDVSTPVDTYAFSATCNSSWEWITTFGIPNNGPFEVKYANSSSLPDGNYWFYFYADKNTSYYTNLIILNNEVISGINPGTRISTTVPVSGSTVATSTNFEFGATGYVSSSDYDDTTKLIIRVHNLRDVQSNMVGPMFSGLFGIFGTKGQVAYDKTFKISLVSSGVFDRSVFDSVLGIGEYFASYEIVKDSGLFGLFTDTLYSTTTSFLVSTSTEFGQFQRSISQNIASTTQGLINGTESCNFSLGFNFMGCMYALANVLFVPDTIGITQDFDNLKHNVLYSFPIGYVTDFIDLVSTTTIGSLTLIDTDLPSALPFGSHITLDLSHKLDYILYSTSTQFHTSNSTTTENFYTITNYYWRIVLIVLTVFYLISRVLGSHIIPKIRSKL